MDKEYINFISNKRVILVGPSKSIEGTKQGNFINDFDVVVRMNKAIPIPADFECDIGSKTDVLYNCLEPSPTSGGIIDPKLWKQNGVKWVASPYPGDLWFIKQNYNSFIQKNNGLLNLHTFNKLKYENLEKELNTRPNTGLLAIIDLLDHGAKELHITGMTFGRDGYFSKYPGNISLEQYNKMANGPNHKQAPQEEYFKKLVKEENRIKLDYPLQRIVNGEW